MPMKRALVLHFCVLASISAPDVALAQQPVEEPPPPLPPPEPPPPETIVVEPPPSSLAEVPLPPRPERDPKKVRTSIKGEIGAQYVHVFDVPITAMKVNLLFGAQNDSVAHYGLVSFMVGSTEQSRRAWDLRLGYMGDLLRFGVLRAGLGGQIGYLVIRRVSYDDRAYAMGIGALAHVGVDLFPYGPAGDHALTLDARFEAHIHFGNAFMWGPSILAGYRW
jgi:hypothetical protein